MFPLVIDAALQVLDTPYPGSSAAFCTVFLGRKRGLLRSTVTVRTRARIGDAAVPCTGDHPDALMTVGLTSSSDRPIS